MGIQKKVINFSLIFTISLTGYSQTSNLFSVNNYLIDKYSENVLCDSSILKVELLTNCIDTIFFIMTNLSSDTIYLPQKVYLECPKPTSYILFCLGDSSLSQKKSSNEFNNDKNLSFHYSEKYYTEDLFSGIIDYKQIKILSKNMVNRGMAFISPKSIEIIPLDVYFKNKYMFIKFQTIINKNGILYKLQKETNSIYMP